ncbi:hypothetical protein [Marinobacter xiaoshiensis]|uniref:Transposase n=1 Tax=Marinobacter xiaoshiensis TaxID=3073652 RepID=A0ABU2HDD1_9GAMM|nr:hypothetical protein [Marinobacter sp. F60267]MDS1309042.1 hypothetical protein [Marinobacter sp. F60267]
MYSGLAIEIDVSRSEFYASAKPVSKLLALKDRWQRLDERVSLVARNARFLVNSTHHA